MKLNHPKISSQNNQIALLVMMADERKYHTDLPSGNT